MSHKRNKRGGKKCICRGHDWLFSRQCDSSSLYCFILIFFKGLKKLKWSNNSQEENQTRWRISVFCSSCREYSSILSSRPLKKPSLIYSTSAICVCNHLKINHARRNVWLTDLFIVETLNTKAAEGNMLSVSEALDIQTVLVNAGFFVTQSGLSGRTIHISTLVYAGHRP